MTFPSHLEPVAWPVPWRRSPTRGGVADISRWQGAPWPALRFGPPCASDRDRGSEAGEDFAGRRSLGRRKQALGAGAQVRRRQGASSSGARERAQGWRHSLGRDARVAGARCALPRRTGDCPANRPSCQHRRNATEVDRSNRPAAGPCFPRPPPSPARLIALVPTSMAPPGSAAAAGATPSARPLPPETASEAHQPRNTGRSRTLRAANSFSPRPSAMLSSPSPGLRCRGRPAIPPGVRSGPSPRSAPACAPGRYPLCLRNLSKPAVACGVSEPASPRSGVAEISSARCDR